MRLTSSLVHREKRLTEVPHLMTTSDHLKSKSVMGTLLIVSMIGTSVFQMITGGHSRLEVWLYCFPLTFLFALAFVIRTRRESKGGQRVDWQAVWILVGIVTFDGAPLFAIGLSRSFVAAGAAGILFLFLQVLSIVMIVFRTRSQKIRSDGARVIRENVEH